MPLVQKISLCAYGTPVNGEAAVPFAMQASAARACSRARSFVTDMKLFSAPSSREMRSRKAVVTSTLENVRSRSPLAISATVILWNVLMVGLCDDDDASVVPTGENASCYSITLGTR